jgi:PhnB protein
MQAHSRSTELKEKVMLVQPYLNFDGRCEEAVNFYVQAIGAKQEVLLRVGESPEAPPPGMQVPPEKIMHASFRIGDSVVMASDCYCQGQPKFQGITLSISVKDEAEADRVFNALADNGKVQMPLSKTFFSPYFGMAEDKFGVSWMVIVPSPM